MSIAKILVLSGAASFAVGLVLGLIVWLPKWWDGLGWPWDPRAWRRRMAHRFLPMSVSDAKLMLLSLAMLAAGGLLFWLGKTVR